MEADDQPENIAKLVAPAAAAAKKGEALPVVDLRPTVRQAAGAPADGAVHRRPAT